jgi:hypothetical protein
LQKTTAALDDAARRLSRLFLTQLALNSAFGIVIGAGRFPEAKILLGCWLGDADTAPAADALKADGIATVAASISAASAFFDSAARRNMTRAPTGSPLPMKPFPRLTRTAISRRTENPRAELPLAASWIARGTPGVGIDRNSKEQPHAKQIAASFAIGCLSIGRVCKCLHCAQ